MTSVGTSIGEIATVCYCEGARARIYGRLDRCPYPDGSREQTFWIDGWTHYDELNGGGPRLERPKIG